MRSAIDRVADANRSFGAAVPDQTLEGLAGILERLEAVLSWPPWREWAPARQASSEPESGTDREITLPPIAPAGVEEAHRLARRVSKGGAYTWIAEHPRQGRDPNGPLAGVPFAVKDLMAVSGRPLGAGSAVRAEVPAEVGDAPIVSRLLNLGAVLIGTTSLHEFAFGVTGLNSFTGTTANPFDAGRVPGGSSGGSAVAVAEGSSQISIGSDTGGSIRIPAALCGVAGFKPAYGSYPTEGVFPLAPSLDHVGLLAASASELAAVHKAMGYAGAGPGKPGSVGLPPDVLDNCDPAVEARFKAALDVFANQGIDVQEIEWPGGEEVFAITTAIMFAEAAAVHHAELRQDAQRYGVDVRARLVVGSVIPARIYAAALHMRERVLEMAYRALDGVDCVIGPTVEIPAPTHSEASHPEVSARLVAQTRLANLTGLPAVSIPLPGSGLPVGMQVTAATNVRVLANAQFFEEALGAKASRASGPDR